MNNAQNNSMNFEAIFSSEYRINDNGAIYGKMLSVISRSSALTAPAQSLTLLKMSLLMVRMWPLWDTPSAATIAAEVPFTRLPPSAASVGWWPAESTDPQFTDLRKGVFFLSHISDHEEVPRRDR